MTAHHSSSLQPLQVTPAESAIILALAQSQLAASIPLGDWVEFGCYRGDTSIALQRLLQGTSLHPQLYLYDSFEGLPPKTAEDASTAGTQFQAGQLDVTKKSVILRFKKAGLRVPKIKKAFFANLHPDTDLPAQISFGFLDGDLYQSIKTSLQLCYPRLTQNAILIVHDYQNPELPGVTLAVDQFLRQHPHVTMTQQHSLAILHF